MLERTEDDVVEGDILGMAQIEAPCRQFLELGELGVRLNHLGDAVEVFGRGAAVGEERVAAAGGDYLDVLQRHVLDFAGGDAHYTGRRDVARHILYRSFIAVASVGLERGNLSIDIADGNVAHGWALALVPSLAGTQEDDVASIDGPHAIDLDIVDDTSIDSSEGDGRAIRVIDGKILDFEVAEASA